MHNHKSWYLHKNCWRSPQRVSQLLVVLGFAPNHIIVPMYAITTTCLPSNRGTIQTIKTTVHGPKTLGQGKTKNPLAWSHPLPHSACSLCAFSSTGAAKQELSMQGGVVGTIHCPACGEEEATWHYCPACDEAAKWVHWPSKQHQST